MMQIQKAIVHSRGLPQQNINQNWSLVGLNFWEVHFLQTVTNWQAEPFAFKLSDRCPLRPSKTAARKLNGRLHPAPCLSSAIQDCVTRDFCLQMALTLPCSHREAWVISPKDDFTRLLKESGVWSVQRWVTGTRTALDSIFIPAGSDHSQVVEWVPLLCGAGKRFLNSKVSVMQWFW